jgi:hypothetical protein
MLWNKDHAVFQTGSHSIHVTASRRYNLPYGENGKTDAQKTLKLELTTKPNSEFQSANVDICPLFHSNYPVGLLQLSAGQSKAAANNTLMKVI